MVWKESVERVVWKSKLKRDVSDGSAEGVGTEEDRGEIRESCREGDAGIGVG